MIKISTEKNEKIAEVSKGLTIRALAIGIVLAVVISFLMLYLDPTNWMPNMQMSSRLYDQMWDGSFYAGVYIWVFPLVFIGTLILVFLQRALSLKSSELAVIFAMILPAFFLTREMHGLGAVVCPALSHVMYVVTMPSYGEHIADMVPLIPAVERSRLEQIFPYSAPKPIVWDVWFTPIAFQVFYSLFLAGAFFVSALLFTKPLVENERLTFPNAYIVATMISDVEASGKTIIKNKWTYTGMLVGLILGLPEILYHLALTVFPTVIDIKAPPKMIFDLTTLGPIPWAPIVFTWSPFFTGLSFFISTGTLLSILISIVVFAWIVPPILTSAGYMPAWEGQSWFLAVFNGAWNAQPQSGGWWFLMTQIGAGIILAAAIYTVVNHRKYLLSVIKGTERNEMPYRYLLISSVILVVLYTALSAAVGAITWVIAVTAVLSLFMVIGLVRAVAETGYWGLLVMSSNYNGVFFNTSGVIAMSATQGAGEAANEFTRANWMTLRLSTGTYLFANTTNSCPSFMALDEQQVADMTRTSKRDVLVAGLIGLILILVIGPFYYVWTTHHWGYYTSPNGLWLANTDEYNGTWLLSQMMDNSKWDWLFWGATPNYPVMYGSFAAAAVVGLVLYYLRRKYSGFFFNPIAIYVATTWSGPLFFFPVLIAYIVRALTIRFFGAKFLVEKLYPLAIGMVFIPGLFWGIRWILLPAMTGW